MMKNSLGLLVSAILMINQCYSQSWSWINSTGNSDNDVVKNVSIDSSGNSYVTGVFRQTMFAGPNQITSNGGDDFFIACYDNQGILRWAKSGGGVSDDGYTMISVTDRIGNTTVALAAVGSVQFGTYNLFNILNDITLVKYDSMGSVIYARSYGSNSNDIPMGAALDTLGNLYVTGFFNNNATFGSTTLNSYGLTDFYLAKFDYAGNALWAKHGGSSSYDAGTGIAIDKFNHVCITGYFNGQSNFDGKMVTSSGGDDIMIASYDSDGNINWVKSGNGTGAFDIGNKIDVDREGNIYVVGQFSSTINFDSFSKPSYGLTDVFISSCDSAGNFKWLRTYGGSGDDVGYDIDVLANGNMVYSGFFSDTATFETNTLISNGGMDMFMACNLTSGLMYWIKQNGGSGDDIARSIKAASESECFVAGSYSDYVSFDNFNFTSAGGKDFFAGKLATPLSAISGLSPVSSFNIYPNPLCAGGDVNIDLSSMSNGDITLEIFNNVGSLISKNQISAGLATYTFKFPIVNAGMYNLRLIDKSGKSSGARIIYQN